MEQSVTEVCWSSSDEDFENSSSRERREEPEENDELILSIDRLLKEVEETVLNDEPDSSESEDYDWAQHFQGTADIIEAQADIAYLREGYEMMQQNMLETRKDMEKLIQAMKEAKAEESDDELSNENESEQEPEDDKCSEEENKQREFALKAKKEELKKKEQLSSKKNDMKNKGRKEKKKPEQPGLAKKRVEQQCIGPSNASETKIDEGKKSHLQIKDGVNAQEPQKKKKDTKDKILKETVKGENTPKAELHAPKRKSQLNPEQPSNRLQRLEAELQKERLKNKALQEELEKARASNEEGKKELDDLREQHQKDVENQKQELDNVRQQHQKDVEKHKKELNKIKLEHKKDFDRTLKEQLAIHQREMKKVKAAHETELQKHKEEIEDLKQQRETLQNDLKKAREGIAKERSRVKVPTERQSLKSNVGKDTQLGQGLLSHVKTSGFDLESADPRQLVTGLGNVRKLPSNFQSCNPLQTCGRSRCKFPHSAMGNSRYGSQYDNGTYERLQRQRSQVQSVYKENQIELKYVSSQLQSKTREAEQLREDLAKLKESHKIEERLSKCLSLCGSKSDGQPKKERRRRRRREERLQDRDDAELPKEKKKKRKKKHHHHQQQEQEQEQQQEQQQEEQQLSEENTAKPKQKMSLFKKFRHKLGLRKPQKWKKK